MEQKIRLINADARIEEIKKAYCTGCENYNGVRCRACWVDDAIGLIDDASAVDAAPVVHAKWEIRALTAYCTNCNCANRHIPIVAGINGVYIADEDKPPFCEKCGAKMDQE